jgi:hypothetical protein
VEPRHRSTDLFADEESQLSLQLEALRTEQATAEAQAGERTELARRFEDVARILEETDVDAIWDAATHRERLACVRVGAATSPISPILRVTAWRLEN